MMNKRIIRLGLVAANLMFAVSAFACPMCKDSAANTRSAIAGSGGGGEIGFVGKGFNWSIYALLIGFLCALGMVGFNLTRSVRNADAVEPEGKQAQNNDN